MKSQSERLFAVANTLSERTAKASREQLLQLAKVVDAGVRLVEAVDHVMSTGRRPADDVIRPAIEEIFVDLHVAATLAMGGQYKCAGVILRTVIETALYVVYFVDHPIEAQIWANHGRDMAFREILTTVASSEYLAAASTETPDASILALVNDALFSTYRSLSERVHGKYAFLNVHGGEASSLEHFCELSEKSLDAMAVLAALRVGLDSATLKDSPALQKLIDRWRP